MIESCECSLHSYQNPMSSDLDCFREGTRNSKTGIVSQIARPPVKPRVAADCAPTHSWVQAIWFFLCPWIEVRCGGYFCG